MADIKLISCALSSLVEEYPHIIEEFNRFVEEAKNIEEENNCLRGIAAKVMPCHYCGAEEIAKCPHGFPGCALADDMYLAEESASMALRKLREKIKALLAQSVEQ